MNATFHHVPEVSSKLMLTSIPENQASVVRAISCQTLPQEDDDDGNEPGGVSMTENQCYEKCVKFWDCKFFKLEGSSSSGSPCAFYESCKLDPKGDERVYKLVRAPLSFRIDDPWYSSLEDRGNNFFVYMANAVTKDKEGSMEFEYGGDDVPVYVTTAVDPSRFSGTTYAYIREAKAYVNQVRPKRPFRWRVVTIGTWCMRCFMKKRCMVDDDGSETIDALWRMVDDSEADCTLADDLISNFPMHKYNTSTKQYTLKYEWKRACETWGKDEVWAKYTKTISKDRECTQNEGKCKQALLDAFTVCDDNGTKLRSL